MTFRISQYTGKYEVTIAVPLYNRFKYLNKSFGSLIVQNLNSLEICICDDNSDDGSYEYFQKIQKYFSNLKIVKNEKNEGTYYARKRSVLLSTGEFILSFDPDDFVSRDIALIDYCASQLISAQIVEHEIMFISYKTFKMKPMLNQPPQFRFAHNARIRKDFISMKLNWNLPRKLIQRNLFCSAFALLDRYQNNSYLIYGEDCLIMSAIYYKAQSMMKISNFLYFYFIDLNDSSYFRISSLNQEIFQKRIISSIISHIYQTNFTLRVSNTAWINTN